MSELTEKLHAPCDLCHDACNECAVLMVDAADELERFEIEVERLHAQLVAAEARLESHAVLLNEFAGHVQKARAERDALVTERTIRDAYVLDVEQQLATAHGLLREAKNFIDRHGELSADECFLRVSIPTDWYERAKKEVV